MSTSDLVEVLREAAKILPIKTHDGQDYAEAHGTDFQAMTVRPASFDALNSLPLAIDLIERLTAENARLRSALADILSWFPAKPAQPSGPEWRIRAGERGADCAVDAARAALADGGAHD